MSNMYVSECTVCACEHTSFWSWQSLVCCNQGPCFSHRPSAPSPYKPRVN